MNDFDETGLGGKLLPGVDLTLWMRILFALLLAVVVGGIVLATR